MGCLLQQVFFGWQASKHARCCFLHGQLLVAYLVVQEQNGLPVSDCCTGFFSEIDREVIDKHATITIIIDFPLFCSSTEELESALSEKGIDGFNMTLPDFCFCFGSASIKLEK